jgi:hypothetical protein
MEFKEFKKGNTDWYLNMAEQLKLLDSNSAAGVLKDAIDNSFDKVFLIDYITLICDHGIIDEFAKNLLLNTIKVM